MSLDQALYHLQLKKLQRYQALLIQAQNQISLQFSLPNKSYKPLPSQRALKPGNGASTCFYEWPQRYVFQAHQSVHLLIKGLLPPTCLIWPPFPTPSQSMVIHAQDTSHHLSTLNTLKLVAEVGERPLPPGRGNLVTNGKSNGDPS